MKEKIIEHAGVFLSVPMTLRELSKRTGTSESVLLKEFNNDLYLIDKSLAIRVGNVLNYLEKNHKIYG